MQYLSNSQIIAIIRSRPGGLTSFLSQISIQDLQLGINEAQRLADLRYRSQHYNIHRKNVLDHTLSDVIKFCYNEGLLTYFEYKLQKQSARLQNHPQFGHRLVFSHPQKYYIGEKSQHYNHGTQIQELYGIVDSESQDQQENDQQENDNEENNEFNNENQQNNKQKQNGRPDNNDSSQQQHQFQVSDDFIQYQSEDQLDKINTIKKQKKIEKSHINKSKKSQKKQLHKSQKKQKYFKNKNKQRQQQQQEQKQQEQIQQQQIQSDEDYNLQQYLLMQNKETQKQNTRSNKNEKKQLNKQKQLVPKYNSRSKTKNSNKKTTKLTIDSDDQ